MSLPSTFPNELLLPALSRLLLVQFFLGDGAALLLVLLLAAVGGVEHF